MKHLNLNKKIITLIGFAIRSRQIVIGFEAVKKSINKKKLALILVNNKISMNTYNKIRNTLDNSDIPLIITDAQVNWEKCWGIRRHKLLGIINGIIGNNIMQQLKAGV